MNVVLDRFRPPEAGPHRQTVGSCAWCENDIEDGDEVWEFDGVRYCSYDCLHDYVQENTRVTLARREVLA